MRGFVLKDEHGTAGRITSAGLTLEGGLKDILDRALNQESGLLVFLQGEMDGLSSEWFALIQSVGIIGSLLMGAAAVVRDARAREIENLLTIAASHREILGGVSQRRDLDRIFRSDTNAIASPPTVAEEEFLSLVMVHFQTAWRIAKAGGIITAKELAADMRGFFSLPLPRAVWEKTKQFRNQRFVRFVEKALGN